MRVLLLDSAGGMPVDLFAILLNQHGFEARAVHSSADALRLTSEYKPDWFFAVLNNIVDAKPEDVVLEILRTLPSCRFFITAGHPMPDFEHKLWQNGYALQNMASLPIDPKKFLAFLKNNPDSMIVRAAEGQTPKFIMSRG